MCVHCRQMELVAHSWQGYPHVLERRAMRRVVGCRTDVRQRVCVCVCMRLYMLCVCMTVTDFEEVDFLWSGVNSVQHAKK